MSKVRRCLVFFCVLGASIPPAHAALGEAAASLTSDASRLESTLTVQVSPRPELFSVQRMSLPDSTLLDQYISASGVVFAMNWKGPRPPDLRQLFGTYFQDYQTLAAQPHAHGGQRLIDTGRMTYIVGGHMRAYWGIARVPALMPAGVEEKDLQ